MNNKSMKNSPSKILFSNNRRQRNMWLFDAGLHTQHMKMKKGEWDHEFVQRFLVRFFEGCRNRGGKQYRDYMMQHRKGDDYIIVWGIK